MGGIQYRRTIGDVQNLTVSLEHMSPNTLYFWLSKFVSEVANQNGERSPPNSLYLLICAVNCHLCETGGEDAFSTRLTRGK